MTLKRRKFLALLLALPACASTQGEEPHWSYDGEGGPEHWAELSPEFATCSGKNQSPVNLTDFVEADLEPLQIDYRPGGRELVNNGHTIQVDYAPGSWLLVDDTRFELKQFHFHVPSENQIDGKIFAMEAHLVHADPDGNLAVLAILYDEGPASPGLATFWSKIPPEKDQRVTLTTAVDAAKLLPKSHDYYRFNGSLTTPPCSEGVRWLVLKEPATASPGQVESLLHVLHHPNNRPVQPIHARPVLE